MGGQAVYLISPLVHDDKKTTYAQGLPVAVSPPVAPCYACKEEQKFSFTRKIYIVREFLKSAFPLLQRMQDAMQCLLPQGSVRRHTPCPSLKITRTQDSRVVEKRTAMRICSLFPCKVAVTLPEVFPESSILERYYAFKCERGKRTLLFFGARTTLHVSACNMFFHRTRRN